MTRSMSVRLLFLLLALVWSLLSSYWLVAIGLVTWIAYWHPVWWLFILAVLLDGYFGAFYDLPILSLGFGAFVLLVEVFKVQLRGTV